MSAKKFTVLDLVDMKLLGYDALNLKCLAGRRGLPKVLTVPEINRPGLALAGFYEAFASSRVQLFGRGEVAYLKRLHERKNSETLKKFFEYPIPCCVFTCGFEPTEEFYEEAERAFCPVLQTPLGSTDFTSRLLRVFSNIFAPKKTLHGVLVEVYGVGILLSGHSGVGKSETALELVERGHRLVADDIIEIRCVNGNSIIGQGANSHISHHMEIRGLGIINVLQLYGVGAVRDQKEVQLVAEMSEWDSDKSYDRLGTSLNTRDLLGVSIPVIEIPVRPGRNLPIIIEAAAMNERLKRMGYDSAKDFNQNVLRWIETGEAESAYRGDEDSY